MVIRVPNNAVRHDFRSVCEYIDLYIQKSLREKNPPVKTDGFDSPL